MPIIEKKEHETFKTSYQEHSNSDYERIISSSSLETERMYLAFNDTDSREKPSPEDLMWNPTDQPLQYTVDNSSHIVRGLPSSGWAKCYDASHSPCSRRSCKDICAITRPAGGVEIADLWSEYPDWATELRLRVKDTAINLGATLAEYRQSTRMFGSAAKGVVNAFRSFRKLRFSKKRTMCDVSAAHLIYDYGVAPLMSDMYDSVEALRLRLERPIYKRFFFKQSCATYTDEQDIVLTTQVDGRRTTTIDRDQYVCSHALIDVEGSSSMFLFGNPLEIAWELVPYSFVIDWFIPIGDALIALDALKNVDRIKTTVTRKWYQYDSYELEARDFDGAPYPIDQIGECTYDGHWRTAYESVPLPSIPKLDFNASINKLLNATSLLHVARGCKGRKPRFAKRDFGM